MSKVSILFGGDLHKRSKDITTIRGYSRCCKKVQLQLMKLIEDKSVDYFISLGDWYDKGYASDVAGALADTELEMIMATKLRGNFYGLIGNHIRLNMDSNPELYLIQPHPRYKSRVEVERQEQIIKTPDMLRVGNVQISFMHHRLEVEDVLGYKPHREPWAKYHIALFHTPLIIPYQMLSKTSMGYNATPSTKIVETLDDVDLAICGDIHMPLGQFRVGERTTMIVPGSLTNTDAGERGRHGTIALPFVEITDDDKVALSYVRFDLCTNILTFMPKNTGEIKDRLKTTRGDVVSELYDSESKNVEDTGMAFMTLNMFMLKQSWTAMDKKLFRLVLDRPDDLKAMVDIYKDSEGLL